MTLAQESATLSQGAIGVEAQIPWSSNSTFQVTLTSGDHTVHGIYKPLAGEQQLWDFPAGLYKREVAAFELSKALRWNFIPETIVREDGPFGVGSIQLLIDADLSQHYFTLFESPANHDALRRIATFDILANNADRKSGHTLADREGKLWGIDQGLCFNVQPKLRTVIWEFANEVIPAPLTDDITRVMSAIPASLTKLLANSECEALLRRAHALIESPVFPEPTARYSYPWPLV